MAMALRRRRGYRDGDAPARTGGAGATAAAAAGGGLLMVARVVRFLAWGVALFIVAGILLIVLDANASNTIVSHVTDWSKTLVGPFKDLFSPSGRKAKIAVNWGIAAAVYLVVGLLIAGLIARAAAAPLRRAD
jgi:hypothetical protein